MSSVEDLRSGEDSSSPASGLMTLKHSPVSSLTTFDILILMVGEVYQNLDEKKGGISRPSTF
jgi:hypothetical protein